MPTQSHELDRRNFLKTGAALLGSAALLHDTLVSPAHAASDAATQLEYVSATEAARAIQAKEVTSVELTEHILARIEKFNPKLNSIVVPLFDEARARAKEADAALAKGDTWGPLHGVPITIKETFGMKGVATTAGNPVLKDNKPDRDATVVERMRAAGGVILGKTNVPLMASDIQSYNEIYGTTNNPWDLTRTPGGSTGGGAASLAAGMTYLETGSDIGGSIRTPAHFCGVYGHKPTIAVVPRTGHIPPMPGTHNTENGLSVAGPLARNAADLMLAMQILGGPDGDEATAYRWEMPKPRRASLQEYKVGYVIDDPICPVIPEQKEVLANTIAMLKKAGVQCTEGWPEGVNPAKQIETYLYLLIASLPPIAPPPPGTKIPTGLSPLNVTPIMMRASAASQRDYTKGVEEQLEARAVWQRFFTGHDLFLLPVNFTTAFPHDHSPFLGRVIETAAGPRAYTDLLYWISFATLTGLPATSAPVGRTAKGLPVNMQIMGPYLEDATPIDFAGKMAEAIGGFTAPPGYAS